MVLGLLLAVFYRPDLLRLESVRPLLLTLLATCIIASSNYVLNEILDGPKDRLHPKKRLRPVPAGQVNLTIGYAEWIVLGIVGVGLAFAVNPLVGWSGLSLWVLGFFYNVPPIRTKEWAYLDVLSESANNAVRLLLGWFPLIVDRFPPVSLILSYWLLGAFFMATKRLAEYRHIANPAVAAAYRASFAHYNEERLLLSIVFYASACSLFGGIFIVRYHLELILFVPLAAALFVHYLRLGLKPDSPTQNPEKLYRERGFVVFLAASFVVFVVLMFSRIPTLYQLFNVEPSQIAPLWTLG
jgi:4-hydroxybenzoate polyprenyltransferase